jgi:hypothetical protein
MKEVGKGSAVLSGVACACTLDLATSLAQEQRTDGALRAEVWVELGGLRLRINVSTSNVQLHNTAADAVALESAAEPNHPACDDDSPSSARLLSRSKSRAQHRRAMQATKPHAQLLPFVGRDWSVRQKGKVAYQQGCASRVVMQSRYVAARGDVARLREDSMQG